MASRGQTITIAFVAWDTVANAGKTADSANFTLRWIKDGTSSAPTNAASEVDSTNAPGVYKLTLTATECTCNSGVLCGKSSTSGVSIMPLSVTFEQLPTAAPAAEGGVPTVDASGAVTLPANPPAGFIAAASIADGALDGKGDWATSGGTDPLLNAADGYTADSIGFELHQLYRKAFADLKIDRTTSPGWTQVWFDPGTDVEVLRLRLLDIAGNPIKQATTIVAQEVR